MSIANVNLSYIGQPKPAAGGQILANNNQGPLARTLVGLATIVLDGAATTGTINYIDGTQTFGKTIILPVQSVGASTGTTPSLVLTAVAASSGGNAVYTGTITGGASNGLVGLTFTVAGFVNPSNNGVFTAVASTATTLTLNNPNAIAETHAATAQAGVAAYNSVFGDGQVIVGDTVVIAGFTNAANNGTFIVTAVGSSSVTVNNLAAVAEVNPAATLSDVQNATPLAIALNVTGGTQQAAAWVGISVSTITSTGFTYKLSGAGTAANTIALVASVYMPGI
jgi:hypothetical protein